MEFHKITTENLKEILPYFVFQRNQICDYTSLGLYMWIDYFGYEYACDDDVLFLRETKNSSNTVKYMIPLCKSGDFVSHIEKLVDFCKQEIQLPLVLNAVPEKYLDTLAQHFEIEKSFNRDWSDYVYNVSDLAKLSGKKFAKKRNLIHQFCSYYRYRISPLTLDLVPDLVFFVKKQQCQMDNYLENYENSQTIKVLENLSVFNLQGIVIYIDSEIAGFAIGEIQDDTLFVHIEKANREFKGIYQALNWIMINELLKVKSFLYVNREEDVGNEGLRKAKLSYYPSEIINKFEVTIYDTYK